MYVSPEVVWKPQSSRIGCAFPIVSTWPPIRVCVSYEPLLFVDTIPKLCSKVAPEPATSVESSFAQYATDLFDRCGKEALDPTSFAASHVELSTIVTYPIRCLKIIEILGLWGLLEEETESTLSKQIAQFVADFCKVHPGTQHPVSDHWAICLVAPTLLLWRTGHVEAVRNLLEGVIRWIGDQYQGNNFGLAGVWSKQEEEIAHLLGNPFSHVQISRRSECYASTIVLDLAALLGLSDIYELARNDFLAVNAFPIVLEVQDSASQYLRFWP